MPDKAPNSSAPRTLLVSTMVAVIGLTLTAAGLAGTAHRASAGDFDPSPQSTQTVPTTVMSTEQPTQPPATEAATQVIATTVPTTISATDVPTSVPTLAVATGTSQPLTVVTATTTVIQTQGGGVQNVTTQNVAPQTQTNAPIQNIAGVQALPRTGAAPSSGGFGWLLAGAGACLALAGLAGIVRERRRA